VLKIHLLELCEKQQPRREKTNRDYFKKVNGCCNMLPC